MVLKLYSRRFEYRLAGVHRRRKWALTSGVRYRILHLTQIEALFITRNANEERLWVIACCWCNAVQCASWVDARQAGEVRRKRRRRGRRFVAVHEQLVLRVLGVCAGGWHERVVAHGADVTRVQLALGAEGGHSRHERCYRFGHVP